ncbi:MAG TPA: thiosulfate oxidation carrier complex protein SoxZ [Chromatiales bacterium]|jgi:sulfur-oxidizing protein SoxZ|nr:thiosulfate oxidation carrier complex protein SoxZ [Chromatiaceae bacterium]HIB83906.1 thiosulfate oxidation carrier complex protein SoxZ [Chromatiaceae bacterium]HIN81318.1 thiosulfate oxidation carrier complex protein SoxZ [Chromatiales bacterium]HIO54766.1 thiosulfate oxidation carrier complex protein SoxZ [Chromatiales bacterium]
MASIKIRAKNKSGVTTVKCLMTHPMETGSRKNKKTGKLIPAHFIQEVTADLNGTTVLTAHWGGGVSKNPYMSFKLNGAASGDSLKINWVDNQGNSESAEAKVK